MARVFFPMAVSGRTRFTIARCCCSDRTAWAKPDMSNYCEQPIMGCARRVLVSQPDIPPNAIESTIERVSMYLNSFLKLA